MKRKRYRRYHRNAKSSGFPWASVLWISALGAGGYLLFTQGSALLQSLSAGASAAAQTAKDAATTAAAIPGQVLSTVETGVSDFKTSVESGFSTEVDDVGNIISGLWSDL